MQTRTQTPGYRYLTLTVLLAVMLGLAGQCPVAGAAVLTPTPAPTISSMSAGMQTVRYVYRYPRYHYGYRYAPHYYPAPHYYRYHHNYRYHHYYRYHRYYHYRR